NDQFKKIGLEKNPGFGLYNNRTIKVKCLADDKLMQPAGNLQDAFADKLPRNKSLPRLAVDAAGGVWVLLRHHPRPGGAGEVWHSYALRYDGKAWSAPRRLAGSSNQLDNRPALAPYGQGILAVYSGDKRVQNPRDRDQNDVYAALLMPDGATHTAE